MSPSPSSRAANVARTCALAVSQVLRIASIQPIQAPTGISIRQAALRRNQRLRESDTVYSSSSNVNKGAATSRLNSD